jgi:LUD domain
VTTSTTLSRHYAEPADRTVLERAATALRGHGMDARIIDAEIAPRIVDELIPDGATVYVTTSRTLDELAIADYVRAGTRYRTTRAHTETLDPAIQMSEFRRHVSTMDVMIGSVHAVTEGSCSDCVGKRQPAGIVCVRRRPRRVVAGAQKVLPDLDIAIEKHSLPLESERLQEVYGMPSAIGKELVVRQEQPGRITALLLETVIGF